MSSFVGIVSKRIIPLVSLAIFLGCATGSTIITGVKRPATSPEEVKVYQILQQSTRL